MVSSLTFLIRLDFHNSKEKNPWENGFLSKLRFLSLGQFYKIGELLHQNDSFKAENWLS